MKEATPDKSSEQFYCQPLLDTREESLDLISTATGLVWQIDVTIRQPMLVRKPMTHRKKQTSGNHLTVMSIQFHLAVSTYILATDGFTACLYWVSQKCMV